MRTTIVIDDKLLADTLRVTGLRTKREVVELGLKTLLRLKQQAEIGKLSQPGPKRKELAGIARGARKDGYRDRKDRY